ncbi:MAG TPA: AraC family transcriptional regulator [Chloroflexota bacterium]|nr:AraC family transcriptional regulator [Chloroflexota bacterium]
MDWQDRMNRTIAWIEQHLREEIEWEDAAREANCSLFHFLRMFEVITGLTAGDYARRRRLSLAAMELASGDAKIIDLALCYGYDSPDAFAKAFRKLFGCTPTEARRPRRHPRAGLDLGRL